MATNTGPQISITRKLSMPDFSKIGRLAAYVGVPSSTKSDRQKQLLDMAGKTKSKKKLAKLNKSIQGDLNNAELLFLFEKGSPINKQPPRPLLGPAVKADGNRQSIANEIAASVKSNLAGDKEGAEKRMLRAALAGQNAARKWFTDGRNAWAPNAASTIARKGSDVPGIDTGALRAAIVGVVREE